MQKIRSIYFLGKCYYRGGPCRIRKHLRMLDQKQWSSFVLFGSFEITHTLKNLPNAIFTSIGKDDVGFIQLLPNTLGLISWYSLF